MSDFEKLVQNKLKKNKCIFIRFGKDDHSICYSPLTDRIFVVSKKIKSKDLANQILKDAGCPKI
ncbi:MAG: type II toxin-antitoxin system HicA family toxin [Deltaproteobacteria bacterium]|jgi:hypothetical protein|nr:type II toxin-antitoxin system HicA family toxin [Deltaproteobacteria bacterium]